MAYEVGQRIRLSTVVRDVAGVPTDATVTLGVFREDGTPYAGVSVVDDPGAGNYHADLTLDTPGRITWEWTASGAVIGKTYGQAYVRTSGVGIVSLSEAKNHLNKSLTDTTDDDELLDWIDAITLALERHVGAIVRRTVIETFSVQPATRTILLNTRPILAVSEIREFWGSGDIRILTPFVDTGPYGDNSYAVDIPTATLTRYGSGYPVYFPVGFDNIRVTYTAGRSPITQNLRLAALELLTHHWRASQISSGASRPRTDVPADTASMGIEIPNRVKILMGARRAPLLGG